jgi:transaldolase
VQSYGKKSHVVAEFRLFVDSAQTDEVEELLVDGLIHGVTTNPTILERANLSPREMPRLYSLWEQQGAQEIFFQSWGDDIETLMQHAREILALGPRVVVKIPATFVGFAAASKLVADGAPVLMTAVYNPAQAVAAASIGARYIAPYLGRLNDSGIDGVSLIAKMQSLISGTGTNVLAASVRSPSDIVDLASEGVTLFTAAPAVLRQAFQDTVSDSSAHEFDAAVLRTL